MDNSVLEQVVRNYLRDPIIRNNPAPLRLFWNFDDIFGKLPKKGDGKFVPGLRGLPPFPKLSALTSEQQLQCLKVLCALSPLPVECELISEPTENDYEVFEALHGTYAKEQQEFIEWAKHLWTTHHHRRVGPKPIVEIAYDTEFDIKAKAMKSFPRRFTMASEVDFTELPMISNPLPITKSGSICPLYLIHAPCEKHPCRFVLPHESSTTTLPLTEVHKALAQYALDNGVEFIASENALKCLLEVDRGWTINLSVCEAFAEDGEKRNVLVLGEEVLVRKESAKNRTYRAFKYLMPPTILQRGQKWKLRYERYHSTASDVAEPSKSTQNCDVAGPSKPTQNRDVAGPSKPTQNRDVAGPSKPTQNRDVAGPSKPTQNRDVAEPSLFTWIRDVAEPSKPTQNRDVAGPSKPTQNRDVAGPSKPTQNLDVAGPSKPTQNRDVAEPSLFTWIRDVAEPSKPTQNRDVAGPSKPTQNRDVAEPSLFTWIRDVAGPSKPTQNRDVAGPSKPTQNRDVAEPSLFTWIRDVAGPSKPTQNRDVAGPSKPTQNRDVAGPSKATQNRDVAGPSKPTQNRDVAGPSKPTQNRDVAGPSKPTQNRDVAGPSKPTQNRVVAGPSKPTQNRDVAGPSKPIQNLSEEKTGDEDEPLRSSEKTQTNSNSDTEQMQKRKRLTRRQKKKACECTCKEPTSWYPPPRSFNKWRLKNLETQEHFDVIIHCPHKLRDEDGELLLEPIPEYQLDLGISEVSAERNKSFALSLYLRENATLMMVRMDGLTGEVVMTKSVNYEQLVFEQGDQKSDIAQTVASTLAQLRHLLPGHYLLHRGEPHGRTLLYTAGPGQGEALKLDFKAAAKASRSSMYQAEAAITPPRLEPTLLPWHMYRKILPCAFTPFEEQVANGKKPSVKKRRPPVAMECHKKKKKKKMRGKKRKLSM